MERRAFLGTLGAATFSAGAAPATGDFTFVHFTDIHIQPERRAGEGARKCFDAINGVPHDFAISGGDLVMDAFAQPRERAKLLFDLYGATVKDLARPVHTIPGNHDVFGVDNKSGVASSDPLYGKKFYEDLIGARYGSFDHKGWHFILLDTIFLTAQNTYEGRLDEQQMEWLRADLAKTARQSPLVVVTHIPLATAFGLLAFAESPGMREMLTVINAREVLALFEGYNLKAVLQGHTHIAEKVESRGAQFITSGAVCGNWWRGVHYGTSEGYAVITVRGQSLSWEYRTFGWKAD